MKDFDLNRRDVLTSSLFAAFSLGVTEVLGSPLNPEQTIIRGPEKLEWKSSPDYPEKTVDRCMLTGDINSSGLYYTLIRWWPGYMSAPHTYTTWFSLAFGGAIAAPISIRRPASRFQPEVLSGASQAPLIMMA